jgi:hypothetical protein
MMGPAESPTEVEMMGNSSPFFKVFNRVEPNLGELKTFVLSTLTEPMDWVLLEECPLVGKRHIQRRLNIIKHPKNFFTMILFPFVKFNFTSLLWRITI